jgi:cell division protein FtsI (penicillin-binding protein 3)
VEQNRAKAGGLVIVDVQSGEILALVNWPTYNPNRRDKVARDRMRNRALTDVFEPGSTLKPFTIAAAMDAGRIRPDTLIATGGGSLTIGTNTIHDAHPEGTLTVEQVIQKSSNVGAAKIALSLPPETMWDLFANVGFGSAPKTGFPGEVPGRLRPAKTWKPIEQATMAYGHGISVNLVQLARAYTLFATDGEVKPVTLLRTDGSVEGRAVLKPATAVAVRRMLEMATQPGGTAPKAQVVGYRVAGKTGTAHKLEGRGYAPNKYVSSFVGFAPASQPRLVVAVMIDEPGAGKYYGGAVAAPVFSNVMGAALRTLGVPTDAPVNNVILPPEGSEIHEET